MKKTIIFSIILFLINISTFYCQEIIGDTIGGFKFTVIGKLKKDYDNSCNCQSLIGSNMIFEFKILDINMDEYFLDYINIIVPCPEQYGKNFFSQGNTYRIEFYDNCTDVRDGWMCDYDIPKRKKMRRRFWVHSITKIDN